MINTKVLTKQIFNGSQNELFHGKRCVGWDLAMGNGCGISQTSRDKTCLNDSKLTTTICYDIEQTKIKVTILTLTLLLKKNLWATLINFSKRQQRQHHNVCLSYHLLLMTMVNAYNNNIFFNAKTIP